METFRPEKANSPALAESLAPMGHTRAHFFYPFVDPVSLTSLLQPPWLAA